MARDFDGVTDRIDYTTNVPDLSVGPFTFAITANAVSAANNFEYLINFVPSADTFAGLFWVTGSGTETLGLTVVTSADPLVVVTLNNFHQAGEHRYLVTWDGTVADATTAHIYKDGVEAGSYQVQTNGSGTPTAWVKGIIGGRPSDDNRNFTGVLAEPAAWDAVLNAGEIAMDAASISPRLIRPSALRFNPPLIRSPHDPITGDSGTLDGTTIVAHPRVFYPLPAISPFADVAITLKRMPVSPDLGYQAGYKSIEV